MRDAFARAIPLPSLVAWSRLRFVGPRARAGPLLMLLELDRELVGKGLFGAGRLVIDLLLTAYVAFELTRRTPRLPGVAAAALLAVGMRWLLVVTRLCGKNVHPAVWVAATLSIGTALFVFARAPTRARLSLELLSKLGISRSDVAAAKRPDPVPGALVVAAAVAARRLPLLLWALRKNAVGLWPQALFFVLYALVVPEVVRRVAARMGSAEERAPRINVVATLLAIGVGLTLTAALLHGTHQFFDAGGELARCTGRLDEASRRLLNAEASELSRRIASVRASTALVLMTTCVMPLAEERIYRGLLMNVLVRRYGLTYGLFVSAAAFGFAHVGIYEIALYQTILLGIGFGLAYLEGWARGRFRGACGLESAQRRVGIRLGWAHEGCSRSHRADRLRAPRQRRRRHRVLEEDRARRIPPGLRADARGARDAPARPGGRREEERRHPRGRRLRHRGDAAQDGHPARVVSPKDAKLEVDARFEAKGPNGTPLTLQVLSVNDTEVVARAGPSARREGPRVRRDDPGRAQTAAARPDEAAGGPARAGSRLGAVVALIDLVREWRLVAIRIAAMAVVHLALAEQVDALAVAEAGGPRSASRALLAVAFADHVRVRLRPAFAFSFVSQRLRGVLAHAESVTTARIVIQRGRHAP